MRKQVKNQDLDIDSLFVPKTPVRHCEAISAEMFSLIGCETSSSTWLVITAPSFFKNCNKKKHAAFLPALLRMSQTAPVHLQLIQ